MNEAKDNLDALSVQIKKLPRDSQFNYLNVAISTTRFILEKGGFRGSDQGPPVGSEVPIPVHGEEGSARWSQLISRWSVMFRE